MTRSIDTFPAHERSVCTETVSTCTTLEEGERRETSARILAWSGDTSAYCSRITECCGNYNSIVWPREQERARVAVAKYAAVGGDKILNLDCALLRSDEAGQEAGRLARTRVTHVREFMFAARFCRALEKLLVNAEAEMSRSSETSAGT